MRVEFEDSSPSATAVLRSAVFDITATRCLSVSYYSSSREIILTIVATPADDVSTSNTLGVQRLSIGQSQMFVNVTPGVYFIDIQAHSIASQGDGAVLFAMIYEIKLGDGPCDNDRGEINLL